MLQLKKLKFKKVKSYTHKNLSTDLDRFTMKKDFYFEGFSFCTLFWLGKWTCLPIEKQNCLFFFPANSNRREEKSKAFSLT